MSRHYFTLDGHFGDAERFIILDTTHWTERNWSDIEKAVPEQRIDVATAIDNEHIQDNFDAESAFAEMVGGE